MSLLLPILDGPLISLLALDLTVVVGKPQRTQYMSEGAKLSLSLPTLFNIGGCGE